jgi:hypothetical protein
MHKRFFPQEKEGVIKRADGGFSTGYSWAFFVPVDEKNRITVAVRQSTDRPSGPVGRKGCSASWGERCDCLPRDRVKAARCLSWVMRDGVNRAPPARRFAAQGCSYIGFGPVTPVPARATALFVPHDIELGTKGPRASVSGLTGPIKM